jgi:hypothetical protein
MEGVASPTLSHKEGPQGGQQKPTGPGQGQVRRPVSRQTGVEGGCLQWLSGPALLPEHGRASSPRSCGKVAGKGGEGSWPSVCAHPEPVGGCVVTCMSELATRVTPGTWGCGLVWMCV